MGGLTTQGIFREAGLMVGTAAFQNITTAVQPLQ